ncbi:MAG: hypothetical protein ABJ242_00960 [Marinomonas sp.]
MVFSLPDLSRNLAGAACVFAALVSSAAQAKEADWSLAGEAYAAGEEQAEMVFDRKAAARCVGRWTVHHDAINDFTISIAAVHQLPDDLRQMRAKSAAEFFRLDTWDERAYRKASNRAKAQLRRAVDGNAGNLRRYFEELGRCSTGAEAVGDAPDGAIEVPDTVDAEAAFAKLLGLEGSWQIAGRAEHRLRIRFYPTAGGSVLVEEWTNKGRPHSLTLYHRDGDTLLATHYCPQGNQPRMALFGDPSGAVRFTFRDITGYDPSSQQFQHDLWFAFDDPDHITRSEIYHDGEGVKHPSALKLERVEAGTQ